MTDSADYLSCVQKSACKIAFFLLVLIMLNVVLMSFSKFKLS